MPTTPEAPASAPAPVQPDSWAILGSYLVFILRVIWSLIFKQPIPPIPNAGLPNKPPQLAPGVEADTTVGLLNMVRPQAEIKLLETLASGMEITFIFIDETHTIRVFNPAAEEMFGYRAEEVIGCDLAMLMPEPESTIHRHIFSAYRTARKATGIQKARRAVGRVHRVRIKRADGTVQNRLLSVTDVDNGLQGAVGLIWEEGREDLIIHEHSHMLGIREGRYDAID